MTVPYSHKVATSSFSCFLRLLFRWKGSIYKLLWKEFAVFALLFYMLGFTYRFALTPELKRYFETLAIYCQEFVDLIPLAFVLGFYVSIVVSRFWEQFNTIPYPTRMAMFVSALVTGIDERGRMMRRTIMRYLCLSHLMTMAAISPPVKKRFPDYQHMSNAGFMLENEQRIIENMSTASNKYFVPLIWSASLVLRARKEGRIKDDFAVKTLIDEINDYRGKCGTLFAYDHVTVPIVYTQVVTIAVYMFFMSCLMGRQFLDGEKHGDLYFPLFTFLQFFFYMGWLKVAESLVNPFGEDDDDFDINGMIDKNLPMSYLIVDEMHNEHPELIKDQYWDSFNKDIVVPYNEASEKFQTQEFIGSAANINIPATRAAFPASVASNMSQMGSQLSINREGKTPKMARRAVRRLGRSTSKLSNRIKSTLSRQSSRLEETREDDESQADIEMQNPNMEEEKLMTNKRMLQSDMFRISMDDESNPPSPQPFSPTDPPVHSTNIFDSHPKTIKSPPQPSSRPPLPPCQPPPPSSPPNPPSCALTAPTKKPTPPPKQPTPPTTPSTPPFMLSSSLTQTDPFITKPPIPSKATTRARTASSSSSLSATSRVLTKVEGSFDGKDGEQSPQLKEPLQATQRLQQPLHPQQLQPLQPSTSSQDKPIPDPFIPSPPTCTQPPTHPLPSTLPPTHSPTSKTAPSTSLRTLDPVMEIAESAEAFNAAVMGKLKDIRENK